MAIDNGREVMSVPEASSVNSPGRRFWRIVIVAAMAAVVVGLTIPNLFILKWMFIIPVSLGTNWTVTAVSPPADAWLRVGDRIDPSLLPPDGRLTVNNLRVLPPGSRLPLAVERAGRRITISIQSPANQQSFSLVTTLVKRIGASLFILVGALLVLMRPSRMTWGFFFFALGSNGGDPFILQYIAPASFDAVHVVFINVIYGLWIAGFWMFASRFPSGVATGWRLTIDRFASLAGVITCVVQSVAFFAVYQGWQSIRTWFDAGAYVNEAGLTIGILSLIGGYFQMSASERQRLKWVVGGFSAYLAANAYQTLSFYMPGGGWPASWAAAGYTIDILNATNLFIPATVVYAVLKHHVLDINFVISRAIVFGALTTILVGAFALVDWFFAKAVEQQRLAVYAEVAVALGLGFSLNGMHRRVDALIDKVLFRRRHLAEARLERIAAGISHATSVDAVDEALVEEPSNALQLTSAAVFRRQGSGLFIRAGAVGWHGSTGEQLSPNDPIVLNMQGERGPMRLHDIYRREDNFPKDVGTPIIGFPLLVRHQLEGLALYGAHLTGEDIDPDEVRTLEKLSASAAAAYDHLEAQNLQKEVESLRAQLRNR